MGREEPARIGLAGGDEHPAGGAGLDQAPVLQNREPVGQGTGERHVVGHEEERHAAVVAELAQERHDLGLHQDVEGRARLVGDEEFRPGGDGERDGDTLALAAGELVRVGGERLSGSGMRTRARSSPARARAPARDSAK